ncbi:MAG: O-antigen ligase family protein [Clostridia bacterium]|nr:O-antigen ligase family protein [Clostridia bacterium]
MSKLQQQLENSWIIKKLNTFTSFLYRSLSKSLIGKFLHSYKQKDRRIRHAVSGLFSNLKKGSSAGQETAQSAGEKKGKKRILRVKKTGRERWDALRGVFGKAFESSFLMRFFKSVVNGFFRMHVRVFGFFLLLTGFGTVLPRLFYYFLDQTRAFPLEYVVAGAGITLVGLLLLLSIALTSGSSIAWVFLNSGLYRLFFKDLLGISDGKLKEIPQEGKNYYPQAVLAAAAVSVLLWFTGPLKGILLLMGIILLFCVLYNPESGLILLALIMPLLLVAPHAKVILLSICCIVFLSFLVKVLVGRRTIHFSLLDYAVFLYGILLLLGGFSGYKNPGSIQNGLLYFFLMIGYFLTANLMRTKKLLDRLHGTIVFSTILLGMVGVVRAVLTMPFVRNLNSSFLNSASQKMDEIFSTPAEISFMLILLLPITLVYLFRKRKYLVSHILIVILESGVIFTLFFLWTRSAWIGFLASILVFALVMSNKTLTGFILAVPAIATVVILFVRFHTQWNLSFVNRFFSIFDLEDASVRYRTDIWKSTLAMIKDNFFVGIGVGEKAFMHVYPSYAMVGATNTSNSHMLYLQILSETGIAGIAGFVGAIVIFIQRSASFIHVAHHAEGKRRVAAVLASVVAFLVAGVFDYTMGNPVIFFLFWMLLGFAEATTRVYEEDDYFIYASSYENDSVLTVIQPE